MCGTPNYWTLFRADGRFPVWIFTVTVGGDVGAGFDMAASVQRPTIVGCAVNVKTVFDVYSRASVHMKAGLPYALEIGVKGELLVFDLRLTNDLRPRSGVAKSLADAGRPQEPFADMGSCFRWIDGGKIAIKMFWEGGFGLVAGEKTIAKFSLYQLTDYDQYPFVPQS
jgi:hypothetical protein